VPDALTDRPRLAAVLGALCIATAALFVREALVSPATATLYRCLLALPVLGWLTWREERHIGARSRRQVTVALVAGVCFGVDLTAFHAAIGDLGAGLATVIPNAQVVIVGVAAWALFGERPAPRLIAAVPIALVGIVLISGVLGGGAYGSDPVRGVVLGLVAAAFYAAYLLILRNGIGDPRRISGPILDATAASAVTGAFIGLVVGNLDLLPGWPALGWLLALALLAQAAGGQLILVSLPRLPAVLTSLILLVQPVVTVVLAVILLGESPSPEQVVGMALVLLALALGGAGRRAPRPAVAAEDLEVIQGT
jgi:drug/metabolite transporter (DMT)-like permease